MNCKYNLISTYKQLEENKLFKEYKEKDKNKNILIDFLYYIIDLENINLEYNKDKNKFEFSQIFNESDYEFKKFKKEFKLIEELSWKSIAFKIINDNTYINEEDIKKKVKEIVSDVINKESSHFLNHNNIIYLDNIIEDYIDWISEDEYYENSENEILHIKETLMTYIEENNYILKNNYLSLIYFIVSQKNYMNKIIEKINKHGNENE